MDAPYLLMFLRHAKFDTAQARGRLDAMERWLRDCGDEIGDVTKIRGTDFVELYEQGFMGVLTSDRRTRDGSCIHLLLPRKMVPLQDPSLLLRWSVWVLMRGVHDPYIQVCGQVIVESVEHYSLFQALRFRQVPREVTQKNLRFAQECMPFRLRGIWVTHMPAWVGVLLAIVRPFLSSKLRPRVRLLGSSPSELAALVDLALLPRELGGSHADAGQEWFRAQLRAEAEAAEGQGEAE
ncbi:hypothetical protein HYH03_013339 [Edaphochlamys debaryana]|uniref:CRAL-TRIO domain-containing protein n=1 Tax=Edaphochlamys debaryana TaxID=47281 RepID=A0A835XS94_9CHLO|nr:hypothetical protein HYH03_013339 [Edaphochlamys debaryana]|eukprot:KAG2488033.1 hypothetical protein HYH03_013339 [Edaphochlamys debaryana]